jgi:hypothetical protein
MGYTIGLTVGGDVGRRSALAILVVIAAVTGAGCDSRDSVQPDSTAGEPTTRTVQPWTPVTVPAELAAQLAATVPTSAPASAPTTLPTLSRATSRPADPLATPESSLRYFLSLLERKQLPDMETMTAVMVEPPPDDVLVPKLNRLRRQILRGAKWDLVEAPRIRGAAAAALYRTRFPNGSEEVAPVLLLQLYDRWKIVMGDVSPKKYTPGEKEDMVAVMTWAQQRAKELMAANQAARAASRPAGITTTAPAAATPPSAAPLSPAPPLPAPPPPVPAQ